MRISIIIIINKSIIIIIVFILFDPLILLFIKYVKL